MNKFNIYETTLNVFGISFSLAHLQNLIGIIVGVLTLISILYRFGMSVYNHVKNKQFKQIESDIENVQNELVEFNNKIEKGKEENKNECKTISNINK